jgi:hypothetical protein
VPRKRVRLPWLYNLAERADVKLDATFGFGDFRLGDAQQFRHRLLGEAFGLAGLREVQFFGESTGAGCDGGATRY